jgi:hypothetical protein
VIGAAKYGGLLGDPDHPLPIRLQRHGGRKVESGQAKSITDLAEQEGVTDAYVCRFLPPDIVGVCLLKVTSIAQTPGNMIRGWRVQRDLPVPNTPSRTNEPLLH